MAKKTHIVVGLDIGTHKICAVVGEQTEQGPEVVGVGISPSLGLRKGVVINVEATMDGIRKAVAEAEIMAGCEINTVFVGIAGGHIRGFNSHGVVAIKNREVTGADVERVIDGAKAVAIPMDREVLHVLPQEFAVDDQDGIQDPRGMAGVRLEASVHMVTGAVAAAQNIIKCCNGTGLNVADFVLEPLASADATLTKEEKEVGVALVDMGGGTTDIALFHGGSVKHTAVLSVGGNHLTSDIAAGLHAPMAAAEQLKQRFGCVETDLANRDEMLDVPSVGGRSPRSVSRQILCEIIEPRLEEVFHLVRREIGKSGYEDGLVSGIVMTGGTTLLPGIVRMAERLFDVPVRQGVPANVTGLVDVVSSPVYATGTGLLLHGLRQRDRNLFRIRDNEHLFCRVRGRMTEWFKEFF